MPRKHEPVPGVDCCKTPGCSNSPNPKGFCSPCWSRKISAGRRAAAAETAPSPRDTPVNIQVHEIPDPPGSDAWLVRMLMSPDIRDLAAKPPAVQQAILTLAALPSPL